MPPAWECRAPARPLSSSLDVGTPSKRIATFAEREFIIWFGIGEGSKYATIAFGKFFPTVINTFGGVNNVDRSLIRMGQAFNLKRRTIVARIILPATLPSILSAFRISASIGIILLVAAEMVAAQYGIGAY
ncbi:MAG: ABC transporter permease subunit, partial [Sinobacteraceae bacterium]|nr:ABC transporter permease subunit [Nevskiaceae bacterium]